MSVSPVQLFENDPKTREAIQGCRWRYAVELGSILLIAESALNQEDPLGYLDSLRISDEKKWLLILKLISDMPPEIVAQEYGPEYLAYGLANVEILAREFADFEQRLHRLREAVLNHSRYVPAYLLWARGKNISVGAQEALLIHDFYKFVEEYDVQKLPLADLLKANAQKGIEISDKRAQDYSLQVIMVDTDSKSGHGWSLHKIFDGYTYSAYQDCPFAIVLNYKGLPNALIGIDTKDTKLIIPQIQGIQGRKRVDTGFDQIEILKKSARGLMPLEWQKLLVAIAETIGKEFGFNEAVIQSAENNKWVKLHNFSKSAAKSKYDNVAKDLGYELGQDGNWHKALAQAVKS